MRSPLWIALAATVIAAAVIPSFVAGSHRSIHLNSTGLYRGLVVGFSNDFRVDDVRDQIKTVESLKTRLQSVSNILHRLLGVRIGEVTIVLPDGWTIADRLNFSADTFIDVPRKTLAEADIIFTDLNHEQILTPQWGECGEPGKPIHFPKAHMSDGDRTDRLLAHQWLLYRYGVFNEFGYVEDDTYPVYFRPVDGGALDPASAKSYPSSCADKEDIYKLRDMCENMPVDPTSGRPLNPLCDLIPLPNATIHSSFLYAPLVVAADDYHICNASSHDYTALNKQNIICDNKSPYEIIRGHSDFEEFPLGGKPNLPPNVDIKFKIWQNKPNNQPDNSQLAHVFYALPQGFRFTSNVLGMIQKFSEFHVFEHMVKIANYKGELLEKVTDNWVPSQNLPIVSSQDPTNSVNLSSIFASLLKEFQAPTGGKSSGGMIVFVMSGNYSVPTMQDPNSIIEKLADDLNQANIALKVVVIDRIPDKVVVRFFDQLVNRLTTMRSSVHYAVAPQVSDNGAQTRVYSELMTFLYDSLMMATEQSHIMLKRNSSSGETAKEFQVKFSIDSGFKDSEMANKWLLVEVYSLINNQINLGRSRLYSAHDHTQVLTPKFTDGRDPYIGFLIFKGTDLKSGNEYIFNSVNQATTASNIAVSVRVLSTSNVLRSYYSNPPVTGNCWVQSPVKNYPLRGYVQLQQGWNAPVYDSEVTMIVRRYNTATQSVKEFQIPLVDNGRASPDLTQNDGIYSSYLDNALADLPDGDVVFQVSARVSSSKVAVKPGNFGNTVLYSSQPRCCGKSLKSYNNIEDIISPSQLDRVIDCGSFHLELNQQTAINRQNYAIRDLRIVSVDADNRTVTIEWNSPFVPSTAAGNEHNAEVKFFYSKTAKSSLPSTIKDKFSTAANAEIELVNKVPKGLDKRSLEGTLPPQAAHGHSIDNTGVPENHIELANSFNQDEEDGFSYGDHQNSLLQHEILQANVPSVGLANSVRKVTINVKQPDAGYYFIAVQERDAQKQTRPSNVVAVYLKKDPHIQLDSAGMGWEMILLLCIASALVLFILILVAICFTIRRRRQSTKETDVKAFESSNMKNTIHESNKSLDATRRGQQQYYIGLQNGQQPDRSSLQSENGLSHGSQGPASQHTSCTEVNQVHDGAPGAQYYHPGQYPASEHSPTISAKQMKELNVATLLPNSWDAKDLLDHWGRVQEAKQRHEMPGMLQTTAMPAHSTSDEDTPSPYGQQSHGSQQTPMYYSAHPQQQYMYDNDEFYHPQAAHMSQAHYSPYSNASSIWQHHQQQQQQSQQQQQNMQQRMGYQPTGYPVGAYDEPGLPEYSQVRKVPVVSPQPNPLPNHANISQV